MAWKEVRLMRGTRPRLQKASVVRMVWPYFVSQYGDIEGLHREWCVQA